MTTSPLYADRVKEDTATTGTGTLTLAGASAGYVAFSSVFPDQAQVFYLITDNISAWEVGQGTFTLAGTFLSRDEVLASSNAGALVNFAAGTKGVLNTFPAKATLPVVLNTLEAQNTVTVVESTYSVLFAHHLILKNHLRLGANSNLVGAG